MKTQESLVRLRKFEVDERRRKVADLEAMINDFLAMAKDLDRRVEMEQQKVGVSDVNDCRYPLWAKDAIERRKRLMDSVSELEEQLDEARNELAASFEELKKAEKIDQRARKRKREKLEKAEADELEEIAASRRQV
jgi:flagellar export protein FliJ